MEEEKKEHEQIEGKEIPKGYYLVEVPASFAKVIAYNEKQVDAEELLIKIANAMNKAGLLEN